MLVHLTEVQAHPLENDKLMRAADQRNLLTLLQSLLLPLILCTYRGAEVFPSCIVNTKHLFQTFQHFRFYDQHAHDAANSDPALREQYQRYTTNHHQLLPTVLLTNNVNRQLGSPPFQMLCAYKFPLPAALSTVQALRIPASPDAQAYNTISLGGLGCDSRGQNIRGRRSRSC